MKLIIQLVTLIGAIVSAAFLYKHGWDFTAGTAMLSFVGTFAGSFFLFKPKEMKLLSQSQKVGNNSTAYQSGGDMNIGDKS